MRDFGAFFIFSEQLNRNPKESTHMDAKLEGTDTKPDTKDGATPDAGGKTDGASKDGSSEKTYTAAELQAEVDRRVNQAAETIRKKVQADFESSQSKAAKEAEEKKLAEQGEYQKLLASRDQELADRRKAHEEASPFVERAKAAEKTLADYATNEIKTLGLDKQPHIMELIEGKSATEQLAWIAKHKDSLQKSSSSGLPGTPSDQKKGAMSHEDRLKAAASIRQYGA
jgi:hypothetical protein